ncbi:hypothetical protein BGW80DRAFT_1324941 [Lactifluus volemus]|nr:hypothetical protein BGW80DRAFT_1324941 [Lactifluus volemus]
MICIASFYRPILQNTTRSNSHFMDEVLSGDYARLTTTEVSYTASIVASSVPCTAFSLRTFMCAFITRECVSAAIMIPTKKIPRVGTDIVALPCLTHDCINTVLLLLGQVPMYPTRTDTSLYATKFQKIFSGRRQFFTRNTFCKVYLCGYSRVVQSRPDEQCTRCRCSHCL